MDVSGMRLYPRLFAISSDNLSAHCIGGFQRTWSSGKVCRTCLIDHAELTEHTHISTLVMRDYETHQSHVKLAVEEETKKTLYGVARQPIFESLPYTNILRLLPPDPMHDMVEGSLKGLIRLTLFHLVETQALTLKQFNYELKNFKWGLVSQSKDIPRPIYDLSKTIIGSAAQILNLYYFLPILIGGYIERGNLHWKIFINFKGIFDIILAPKISEGGIAILKLNVSKFLECILEHIEDYPSLFTAKLHYLLHYPDNILDFGPVRHLWCFRFEAKHKYFKSVAKISNNFKNLDYTMSHRHELHQCYMNSKPVSEGISIGESVVIKLSDLPTETRQLVQSSNTLDSQTTILQSNSIQLHGVILKEGDFLVHSIDFEDIPSFMELKICFESKKSVLMCGIKWIPKSFDKHYHSYVLVRQELTIIRPENLAVLQKLHIFEKGISYIMPLKFALYISLD